MQSFRNFSELVLIYFQKTGVYVPIEMLPRYMWWTFRSALTDRSIRHFLRRMWSPKWLWKIPSHIAAVLAVAKSLGLDNGWVRWDTDGSRRQVFDPWRGGICKISKQGAALNISDEVEFRNSLGDLSPRILKCDPVKRVYVEEWVDATSGCCSIDELERVRRVLVSNFYRIEEQDVASYLSNDSIKFSDKVHDLIPVLVRRLGRVSLPISNVHGDLVCANIAFRSDNEPVIYDWEYSRICVVTQDVWFFLYHRASCENSSSELLGFLREFEKVIGWAFPTIPNIRVLHLIHLFEREALLVRNSEFVDSHQALKSLRQSIDDVLSSLNLSNIGVG